MCVAGLAAVLLASVWAAGADYPQWRGPDRDGKSAETGLLARWPDGGPKLLWSVDGLGRGYATVAVADGTVYVTGLIGTQGVLFAFDLDGKPKWKKEYGPDWAKTGGNSYPASRTTPTVDDGLVYVHSGMGQLTCLDAGTGDRKWSLNTFRKFRGRNITWGLTESVLIDGDRLICQPGGRDAAVVALHKKTGKTIWTSKGLSDRSAYCSPIVVERGRRRLIVTVTANAIVGLDAKTGSPLWQRAYRNRYSVHAVTPVYRDGIVYVTSGYGLGGVALKLSDDGSKFEELWRDRKLAVHHGGVVELDGYVYGANEKGWVCLELASGEVKHQYRGVGKGSVTWAHGKLYCYGERGMLALVKATPEAFKTISSFRVTLGDGKHWAHPVVAAGRLFVRHGDVLMAFDVKPK
jgi:outer membrane protein assembly factor BamB